MLGDNKSHRHPRGNAFISRPLPRNPRIPIQPLSPKRWASCWVKLTGSSVQIRMQTSPHFHMDQHENMDRQFLFQARDLKRPLSPDADGLNWDSVGESAVFSWLDQSHPKVLNAGLLKGRHLRLQITYHCSTISTVLKQYHLMNQIIKVLYVEHDWAHWRALANCYSFSHGAFGKLTPGSEDLHTETAELHHRIPPRRASSRSCRATSFNRCTRYRISRMINCTFNKWPIFKLFVYIYIYTGRTTF